MVYVPYLQSPMPLGDLKLHARTVGDPTALVSAVRREIQAVDRNLRFLTSERWSNRLISLFLPSACLSRFQVPSVFWHCCLPRSASTASCRIR
jgi:hypothetical protein